MNTAPASLPQETAPSEELFRPVVEVLQSITGHLYSPSSINEFTTRGNAGVRLESKMVGGRRMCRRSDVLAWIDAVTIKRDRNKVGKKRGAKEII